MRSFMKTETEPDDYFVESGVLGHTVTLGKGTEHEAVLRVYEETMLESTRVHCDCCRCIGWHHHPVTRKQYHFVVHSDFRVDSKPELLGKRICQICTAAAPAKEKICPACGENDKETSLLDYQTHLMHGTLHANGCGHLMRINGREAGSARLSGQQLIQIWEKLCVVLRAREVSVEDVSQKYGVEFRLLNPVACGKTWYGTYGYQFGKGSFGNTAATHRQAAERLRRFPLASVKTDFERMAEIDPPPPAGETSDRTEPALEVIARYEALMKQYAPTTVGGLVALLLLLQRIVRRNDKAEKELVLRERRAAGRRQETLSRLSGKQGKGAKGGGADAKANGKKGSRLDSQREAAAKRKAASSLFEPLKFESKAAKASRRTGDKGASAARSAARAGGPTRVMSSAKPRVTPTRPLRPRGADGLVPATEPELVAEPAPPPSEAHRLHNPQAAVKREATAAAPRARAPSPPPPLPSPPAASAKKGSKKGPQPSLASLSPARTSRWSDARIETACTACVEVLREANGKWMARQEVRARARDRGVGDTGLLDHVLKTISDAKVTLYKLDRNKKNPTGASPRVDRPRARSARIAKRARFGRRRARRFSIFDRRGFLFRLAGMTTTSQIRSEAAPARAGRHLRSDVDVTRRREKVLRTRGSTTTDRRRRLLGLSDRRARAFRSCRARLISRPRPRRSPAPRLALAGPSTRAKVRRRQNSSSGQLEYHLDKVDGMKKMRAKVVPPKQKPADEPSAKKTKAKPEPAAAAPTRRGGGGGKPASGGKGASGERHAAEEAARQLSKSDLDRDVKAVYKSLLESYKPARPRVSESAAKCIGSDLIACARVLLDTKQFVKTYVPVEELLESRPKGKKLAASGATRVMVTAVIDSRNRGPKVSGMGGGGGGKKSKTAKKRREHGVETKPPPEVILLPADPTLAELKAAATKCFQDLYVVLGKFKVRTVVGLESAKETQKVGKKVAGRRVEVHGEGADLQSEFRYQGGLDQWTVRCVCGTTDDDGERMIACDSCEVWMHTRCVGIVDSAGTPRRWTCLECEAEAAAEAAKAAKAAKASGKQARENASKKRPPPVVERVRPPPTKRRPLPERVMPRRKGSVR